MSAIKRVTLGVLAALAVGCEPKKVEPELVLTAAPRTIDSKGQKTTLKALATDEDAKPGAGTVRFSAAAGSLKAGTEVSLLAGEATIDFSCDVAVDPACSGTVRVTAEWVSAGKTITANTNITVTPPVVVVPDAGTATLDLTSSRTQLGIGLGAAADLIATLKFDGVGVADASVTLTTSAGALRQLDGGAFTSPATTDSSGVVRALLVENGVPETATVTASARGMVKTTSVTLYVPDAGLSITSDKPALTIGFGEVALLTVNHTLENRAVAGRPIVVESTAGRLLTEDGGTFVGPGLTDLNGRVQVYLTDLGSPGAATITARDTSAMVSASTVVTLAPPDAGVVVATNRDYLYLGINDAVNVTASLFANGNPTPNRTLQVSSNSLGRLLLPDGGTFSGTGTTDAQGKLPLVLKDQGQPGNAVITATDPMSGRTGNATVSVRTISTVSFEQMTCSGQPCTVLGIRSSNFRTTGKLRFVVRDNQTPPQPVPGVNVTFSIALSGAAGIPPTTIAPSSTTTDMNGAAEVNVNTGSDVGSFTVTATVLPGVAATSPSFGVRGAKPTNNGFVLQCDKTTMSAYTAPTPPLPITANCQVTVVDRVGNYVGLATDVSFRAEAGAIPASAQTPEFSPMNSSTEGRASVVFNTVGPFPADDVPPLTAQPSQFPGALEGEPSRVDGLRTRNPRDGLVVIIAWTRGEEWFRDDDGNGVQNGNEPFVDQGEPFIDTNDNDVFDGNDTAFNVDGNGVYNGPNGVWDADTYVWTKAYVLYTDRSAFSTFSARLPAAIPFNVPLGGMQTFDVWMPDLNRNRIEVGSTVDFVRTATKGTVTGTWFNTGLDGFGFDFEPRLLTNQAGTANCPSATAKICVYKTRFGQWYDGYLGYLTIQGAPSTDTSPTQNESITVRTTTRSGTVPSAPLTGVIQ